jgi:hypothetical protein
MNKEYYFFYVYEYIGCSESKLQTSKPFFTEGRSNKRKLQALQLCFIRDFSLVGRKDSRRDFDCERAQNGLSGPWTWGKAHLRIIIQKSSSGGLWLEEVAGSVGRRYFAT